MTPLRTFTIAEQAREYKAFGLTLYYGLRWISHCEQLAISEPRTLPFCIEVCKRYAKMGAGVYYPYDDCRYPMNLQDQQVYKIGKNCDAKHIDTLYRTVAKDYPNFKLIFCPPGPDQKGFDRLVDLERRVLAQRDRVLADFNHPLQLIAQTHMRWRLTNERGELVAKDIAQATISPRKDPKSPGNFTEATNGTMIAETWIRSPKTQTVGAWIGFTGFSRDHGLVNSAPLPKLGEWNRFGATIELNGEPIPPPAWQQPGRDRGRRIEGVTDTVYEIEEMPFTNDEWYMREPTKIRLRKGWNHVKMTLPMPKDVAVWTQRWVGTFMPVAGTTDHPHEIDDLEYSSDPH